MGISLRNQRKRRRRSYADYRPPARRQEPRNDIFRIIFYLAVIGVMVWVYLNQDAVRAWLLELPAGVAETGQPTPAAALTPEAEQTQSVSASVQELVALAEHDYAEGKLSSAVDYYRQAAELDPGNIDYPVQIARLLLFISAMQYGDQQEQTLAEAEEAANAAILADPFSPAGYAILGKVYDWQGLPDKALSTILQGLDYDQGYVLGLSYYAEALVDLDRWDQALETIELALAAAPDNVDVRRDYAYILERLGDYAAAATQYEAAVTLHPRLPYLRMALGRTYRALERYQEAQDQFFEAQLIEPNNALIPYELGRTFETYIGNPDAALEYYERAVELDEDFGNPWLRMGTLYFFQQRYADAIVAYEHALAQNITHGDLYYQLGLSYAHEGRCEPAIRYLQEAQSRSEGDQRILDAVQEGFDICSQPTPVPVETEGTLTAPPTGQP